MNNLLLIDSKKKFNVLKGQKIFDDTNTGKSINDTNKYKMKRMQKWFRNLFF